VLTGQKFAPYAPGLPFDARRWPNAVTIGWLIAERMGMGVYCNKTHPFPDFHVVGRTRC
jgi:hypothetical protein